MQRSRPTPLQVLPEHICWSLHNGIFSTSVLFHPCHCSYSCADGINGWMWFSKHVFVIIPSLSDKVFVIVVMSPGVNWQVEAQIDTQNLTPQITSNNLTRLFSQICFWQRKWRILDNAKLNFPSLKYPSSSWSVLCCILLSCREISGEKEMCVCGSCACGQVRVNASACCLDMFR